MSSKQSAGSQRRVRFPEVPVTSIRPLLACLVLTCLVVLPAPAAGGETHAEVAAEFMARLRPESRRQGVAMRAAYAPAARRLTLADRRALAAGHASRRIVPLPDDPATFNVRARLDGHSPIGEMDLAHQDLYVAARPETLGLLFDIASRVRSGSVEVTSLVRHRAYQKALARRNANARTAVPTHAMGLAFDISILNTPMATATEIRNVLRRMGRAGDLLFIAEQHQLVFHVVPAPARRGYYAALYHAFVSVGPPAPLPGLAWPGAPDAASVRDLLPVATNFFQQSLEKLEPGAGNDRRMPPAAYAAFLGWLVAAGLGVPPGEDLLLMGAAGLSARGLLAWWPLALLGIIGVVTSDTILYYLGRTAGATLERRTGLLPAPLAARLDAAVGRWGMPAVGVARFVPGTRAAVFCSAGAGGMPALRFLVIDVVAAMLWVPIVMTVGRSVLTLLLGGSAPNLIEPWM